MQLHLIGLNHKTAPIEIREKVAVTPSQLKEALKHFLSQDTIRESAILSTCNRTEVYAVGGSLQLLKDYFQSRFKHIEKYLYHFSGREAVTHLMRVASGLDSMIIGEGQILGQVKEAWKAAQEANSLASLLNSVFNRAISCGKRSRSETKISQGAVSIGSAAAELARKIFGNLILRQVLIIGAGKMSQVAAQHLKCHAIFVTNRTFSRAQELAARIGGKAVKFEAPDSYLEVCDIVITSTGAPYHLLGRSRIQKAMSARSENSLFLIDISVPRNVDPQAAEIEGVYLYDVDDLNAVAAENLKSRQAEIPKVEKIIAEEIEKFEKWFKKAPSVKS